VYGENDAVVPYSENGKILKDYYIAHGKSSILKVIGKPDCGHHPHGLSDPQPIVDFILENDVM
jgi:hypothetical protein